MEEIVGEIIDESDAESKYLTLVGEEAWRVDGRLPVDDAAKLGWPVVESDDYETIAGWLMDMLDYVPKPGDELMAVSYTHLIVLTGATPAELAAAIGADAATRCV